MTVMRSRVAQVDLYLGIRLLTERLNVFQVGAPVVFARLLAPPELVRVHAY